jgi:uncharacterized membrane protein
MPQDNTSQFNPIASLLSCLIAAVILCVALVGNTLMGPLGHAWMLATQQQPEAFTELYFNTSTKHPLPTSAPVGQTRSFSFHISNHEYRSMHYIYHATMLINGRLTPIVTGSVDVKDGQSADITIPFTMTEPGTQATIDVAIDHPSEHISFRSES